MQNPEELGDPDQIKFAAQRLWTSALRLEGRQFCSIVNFALRDDDDAMIKPLATIARGINQLCVDTIVEGNRVRESFLEPQNHPPDNVCFRGGGFDDDCRDFFDLTVAFKTNEI